jgi:hypothetical protein
MKSRLYIFPIMCLLCILPMLSCSDAPDTLYEGFVNPPAEAKPFVRWWWNGNHLTREEIVRELDIMEKAGIGGVEINPIAMPETVENPTGRGIVWLSDEWCELVNFTLDEANNRGIIADIITGTGWPFGGEFLQPEETLNGMRLTVKTVQGPGTIREKFEEPQGVSDRLVQLTMFPEIITSIDDGVDLLSSVQPDGRLEYRVPPGRHKLYAVSWHNNFREVLLGAPGGAGPVIDHFAAVPVQKYLNRLSDKLGPVVGGKLGNKLRAIFCDSIELSGANWTPDFGEQFEQRRGYRVEPWLPFLLAADSDQHGDGQAAVDALNEEMRETVRRVRYDYSRTLAELLTERFIVPFHQWANDNGCQSRYQAYGHPWLYTDMIDGYMIPDIPEGDTWLNYHGRGIGVDVDGVRISVWPKYASSAGHIAGRRLIGSESMTNTRGVFKATLEYVKQGTDLNFFSGANHNVLHGFNYSPPEAGFPGWVRFGTYFNEQNPWWPYFSNWAEYTSRLQWVFQEAQPMAQVAIMGPTPDIWSDHALSRGPFNMTPWYLHDMWTAAQKNGFGVDYVNGSVLQGATFDGGKLRFGPMSYDVLIVVESQTIEPETAAAMKRFVEAGGKIVFVKNMPDNAPGMQARDNRSLAVATAMDAIRSRVSIVDDPGKQSRDEAANENLMLRWVGKLLSDAELQPMVTFAQPDRRLFQVMLQQGNRDIFFIGNMDQERVLETDAEFETDGKIAWLWNPETGARTVMPTSGRPNRLHLSLQPLESILLVFEPNRKETPSPPTRVDRLQGQDITGTWQVQFDRIDGFTATREMLQLLDPRQDAELQNFGGTITYRTTFDATDVSRTILSLGEVDCVSEVKLNGTPLGHRWWGRHEYDVSGVLQQGANTLEVKVATVLFNYAKSLQDNPAARYWTREFNSTGNELQPVGMTGPVRLLRVQ